MVLLLLLTLQGQAPAGPIDGFRANFAAIRAAVVFDYEEDLVDRSVVERGRIWRKTPPAFPKPPRVKLHGEWEYDGTTERFLVGKPGDNKRPEHLGLKAGGLYGELPAYEILYDGQFLANYEFGNPKTLRVMESREPMVPRLGPFTWWGLDPFPMVLSAEYPGVKPSVRTATRGGHPVDVEVYRKSFPGGWSRVEVSYDASIGYLPRFVRGMTVTDENDEASVKETYLIDAQPCREGGFVPTEWFEVSMVIDRFGRNYPKYDDDTELTPSGSRVPLGHFKAATVRDFQGTVRFRHTAEARVIVAPGGVVRLADPSATRDLAEIKSTVGPKIEKPPPPVMPHLDEAELREFKDPARRSYWLPLALVAFGVPALVIALKRRSRFVLLVAITLAAQGCGRAEKPAPHLTASFVQTRLVYDPTTPLPPMSLVVTNDGNVPLRLFKADGGCSCRQVDTSTFPVDVAPGSTITLGVRLEDRRQYEPQHLLFTFDTDHGAVSVSAVVHALPSHRVMPDSFTLKGLDERLDAAESVENSARFEFVHREVYPRGGQRSPIRFDSPPEVALEKGATSGGVVGEAPEFLYEDVTYRATLKDFRLGLHKAVIVATGPGGQPVVEVPVVWQRRPFLAPSPERVVLGDRPIRVFLSCPDEDVEFSNVISAPEGTKVSLVGPRVILVRIAEGAPGILNGVIEVGTTAAGRPPLKIPVVRYAPAARAS